MFWSPPQPGTIRLWRTVPAAIPDTRGSRESEWNFAHAALLSVGFVWKDQKGRLPRISGRGDAYYRGLAAAVSDAGVAIVHAKAIRTSNAGRYVHKVNADAVVRPYTACLSLGSLAGPRTIAAIGQSRHLGGGLLIPFDVPEGHARRRHHDAGGRQGMTVDRGDFAQFFAAVNGGHKPFRWQERLLDTVLGNGRWPDLIAAPDRGGQDIRDRRARLRDRADRRDRRPAAAAPPGHGGRPAGAGRRPVRAWPSASPGSSHRPCMGSSRPGARSSPRSPSCWPACAARATSRSGGVAAGDGAAARRLCALPVVA